jgi:hypothetical protein
MSSLSEDLVELIRKGSIPAWSAARVIVPIARAIPEHGKALTENLAKASLSTREMAQFYSHYQKANRRQRERMVHEPELFLKSLRARQEAQEARALKEGPEGKWLRELKVIVHMLRGLLRETPVCFSSCRSNLDRRILLTAFEESRRHFVKLENEIRSYDDYQGQPGGHLEPSSTGSAHSADQPDPEDLPKHRQAGDSGKVAGEPATAFSL